MSGYDHMFPNEVRPRPLPDASEHTGQPLSTRLHMLLVEWEVGFRPHRHRLTDTEAHAMAGAICDLLDEVSGERSADGMVTAVEADDA